MKNIRKWARKKDFLWLLLYPVYQTIGALRHEGSHALAAMAEGARIREFEFWPSIRNGRFFWGYVRVTGRTTWFFSAAPFFCDLITFFVALSIILIAKPQRRWLWLNVIIIGMLSPIMNSAWAYFRGLTILNDVGNLLRILDSTAVHLYFALTLLLYICGILYCLHRRASDDMQESEPAAGV